MWILDSAGDFLGGKRVWLRPGKKYLFGRVLQDGVRHAISNNSISRKHMIIEVAPVKPGDGSHIYAKSDITVSDEESKCGTTVDGEDIKGRKIQLTQDEHILRLGKYKHDLRIKWEPTVLSFSFSSKDLKTHDPLARVRSRLEDLDIKTVIPYVVDQTTHVVQNKRNTAKGLQALVNGKHIVQDSYIDALVYAATPSDLDNLESLSPLEADFDSAWPDPTEHLPPPGKEAVQRPKEAFAPNPDRINVFERYTFVFGDSTQFDNLQDAVTNGHGKALLYRIENGATTAEEIVQFMRNTAGRNGLGRRRSGPGGVVLVRYRAKSRYEDWSQELSDQVAAITEQRVIEQSEFLDAILANDATSLCTALEPASQDVESVPSSEPPQSAPSPTADVQMVPESQDEPPTQASTKSSKGPRVRSFKSKMKAFDDGFDINAIPAYADDDAIDPAPSMEIDATVDPPTQPDSTPHEEEDVMANLLPGAAAMKRRRAETMKSAEPASQVKSEDSPRPKRQKLDIREAARQHREAEDAQRLKRQEETTSLQDSLKDANVEQLKGLAIVEEMEVPSRRDADRDTRWDDRWNGRKNFKKFRRKGDGGAPRHRIQTVIVPLEEVTRKDFGIGEHYWVSSKPTERSQAESRAASHGDSHRNSVVSQEGQDGQEPESAPSVARTETPAPRSQKRLRQERDSDSEDEMRFRFRRRR
ncbi:DNA damage response protein RcaA [Aspergillus steynii IBT 23096]|uniref:DNA damage response protein RcaA n=1 Tax=Aspergillus steynii IBT 23096 TaxID=1392250 RepID=A0A2I2GFK5_9EURO|nr:DNA damage response protein RcaA [Aspergillus steynii IBT 23096]PLB51617.1 DNA damage response protein RcaA [Aspergillus steynii IBT 23096]